MKNYSTITIALIKTTSFLGANAIERSAASEHAINNNMATSSFERSAELAPNKSPLLNGIESNVFDTMPDHRELQGSSGCAAGFIHCVNGYLEGSLKTCAEACNYGCCHGTDACTGFTGKVCPDGFTCLGTNACRDANFLEVTNSCRYNFADDRETNSSCYKAGVGTSKLRNSCHGPRACYSMGKVGDLTDSCHGIIMGGHTDTCAYMGTDNDDGGGVGNVTNSCFGKESCAEVASGPGASVESITNACGSRAFGMPFGDRNCHGAGSQYEGDISSFSEITDCCNSVTTCCSVLDYSGECSKKSDRVGTTCGAEIIITASPTKARASPTKAPASPINFNGPDPLPFRTPWDINFVETIVNFTSRSDKELMVKYTVGDRGNPVHFLKAGGCQADPLVNITGLVFDQDLNVTANKGALLDGGMVEYQLDYSFDKSKISTSNIWQGAPQNKIELCQIVQLKTHEMVIQEHKTNLTIDFDVIASFALGNDSAIELAEATIEADSLNTTLDSYISAYKCDAMGAESTSASLAPNKQLSICVKSNSPDVQIQKINIMTIDGKNPDGITESLVVMVDGNAKFNQITFFEIDNARSEPEAIITTFVPSNLFDYEAENAGIDVYGAITVKLAGTRRMLMDRSFERLLQSGEDSDAVFDLTVNLAPDENELDGAMVSSGKALAHKVSTTIAMFTASVSMYYTR